MELSRQIVERQIQVFQKSQRSHARRNKPEWWLDERSGSSNCFKLPIFSGIIPVSWFQDKFRVTKVERFVISSGITPDRLLHDRSMIFTREIMLVYSTSLPSAFNSA
ncbi:hypothetical protein Peur_005117 [Populus x canadensis]